MKQSKHIIKALSLFLYGCNPEYIRKEVGISPRRLKKALQSAPKISHKGAMNNILNHTLNKGRNKRFITCNKRFMTYGNFTIVKPNPRIICNDGYEISIQCSEHTYCNPQESILDVSKYSSFELGYPNQYDSLLDAYEDGDVFPYTPRYVVINLILKHGGIKL
jgi:hypothetical protein